MSKPDAWGFFAISFGMQNAVLKGGHYGESEIKGISLVLEKTLLQASFQLLLYSVGIFPPNAAGVEIANPASGYCWTGHNALQHNEEGSLFNASPPLPATFRNDLYLTRRVRVSPWSWGSNGHFIGRVKLCIDPWLSCAGRYS